VSTTPDWKPELFDAHQNETVVVLSELIIPATDTPGAKAALALASVSMVAMISCATTVDPSALVIFTMTPSAGAGNSSTTLSVSTSTRFSSRLTASPSFLCHDSRVASDTDSDSCGTFTSISMDRSVWFFRPVRLHLAMAYCKNSARNAPDRGAGFYAGPP